MYREGHHFELGKYLFWITSGGEGKPPSWKIESTCPNNLCVNPDHFRFTQGRTVVDTINDAYDPEWTPPNLSWIAKNLFIDRPTNALIIRALKSKSCKAETWKSLVS